MKRNGACAILLLFIISMIARKAGIGLSSLLLICTIILLCYVIVFKFYFFNRLYIKLPVLLFTIYALLLLQYWIPLLTINIGIFKNVSVNLFLLVVWIIFSIISLKNISDNRLWLSLWLLLSFIFTTSAFLNPREFHNLYRSSTYEEYIRQKYTEPQGLIADYFIDKYKKVNIEKSEKLLHLAIEADSIHANEKAMVYFNRCIDNNPDNAIAYHKRGYFKLTRLEINEDVAYSAIKDFSRAIRLNPEFTDAYFHRGVAYGYLKNRGRSIIDMKKVWTLDSTLSENEFQKKYGSSKKSFSIPFYP